MNDITRLGQQYRCPHFRILVIGRANAGKTTILEKVCGVAKGTKPIIHDEEGRSTDAVCICIFSYTFGILGNELPSSAIHLMPSIEVILITN